MNPGLIPFVLMPVILLGVVGVTLIVKAVSGDGPHNTFSPSASSSRRQA